MKTKKFFAVGMAVVMMFGSSITALADDTTAAVSQAVSVTGADSSLEGVVNKDVWKFTAPTVTASQLQYIPDPQGLLFKTGGESLGDLKAASTIAETTTMYWKNYGATDQTGISATSDTIKCINKSSFDIKLSLTLTGAVGTDASKTNVAFATTSDYTGTDEATAKDVYIEFTDNKGTATQKAFTGAAQTVDAILGSAAADYEYVYNKEEGESSASYKYRYKGSTDFSPATYEYSLTGTCNPAADWYTDNDKLVFPTISIAYTVAKAGESDTVEIEAGGAGSSSSSGSGSSESTYAMTKNSSNALVYTFSTNKPSGEFTSVLINTKDKSGQIGSGVTYSADTGLFKIKPETVTNMNLTENGTTVVATIGGKTYTLTY